MGKKLNSFLLCSIVLLMSACNSHSIVSNRAEEIMDNCLGENIYESHNLHSDHLIYRTIESLAWEENGNYVVVVSTDARIIDGCAVFSSEGHLLCQTGISVIEADDITSILNMAEEELSAKYGKFHFDFGSGRYLPAYITNCGSVLVFDMKNRTVDKIVEYRFTDGKTYEYRN